MMKRLMFLFLIVHAVSIIKPTYFNRIKNYLDQANTYQQIFNVYGLSQKVALSKTEREEIIKLMVFKIHTIRNRNGRLKTDLLSCESCFRDTFFDYLKTVPKDKIKENFELIAQVLLSSHYQKRFKNREDVIDFLTILCKDNKEHSLYVNPLLISYVEDYEPDPFKGDPQTDLYGPDPFDYEDDQILQKRYLLPVIQEEDDGASATSPNSVLTPTSTLIDPSSRRSSPDRPSPTFKIPTKIRVNPADKKK
jgi:hypothetical protein